jgi:hypothetical protein
MGKIAACRPAISGRQIHQHHHVSGDFAMLHRVLLGAFAALFSSIVGSALAQEDPPIGSVTVNKLDSFRCQKLTVSPESTAQFGFLRTLTAPKGREFLVLWTDLTLKWAKNPEGKDVVYLRDPHISIKDSKGNSHRIVGYCTRDGRFDEGEGWLSENKEYNEEGKVAFNPVFAIPAGEQEFTLQIGPTAHKFIGPMKVAPTIDRAAFATFKIDGVRLIKNLSEERSLREYEDDEIEGAVDALESTATQYIAVKILIKPKFGNDAEGDLSLYSSQIGLKYGAQVYVGAVGHFESGAFRYGQTGVYDEPDAAGEFRAEAMELVFPLPGKLTTFRAMYLMQDIGGGTVPAQ